MNSFYSLPSLPYDYDALAPVLSAEQIRLHHDKHHKVYVEKANELLEMLDKSKAGESGLEFTDIYKKLTFNVGGHILHSLYWENMKSPAEENGPEREMGEAIDESFGGFENFKEQFFAVGTTVEGSAWAALFYDEITKRLLIGPIQNHNLNVYPSFKILLVMDMWEHAYYFDYLNEKKKYAEEFWRIVHWGKVMERYREING